MFILLTILIVFCAILLVLLVLVQNSKGGGLASGFAGGNQVMGAPKTADFLEKATWTLAAIIVALSIVAVGIHTSQSKMAAADSALATAIEEIAPVAEEAAMEAPGQVPVAVPAEMPVEE